MNYLLTQDYIAGNQLNFKSRVCITSEITHTFPTAIQIPQVTDYHSPMPRAVLGISESLTDRVLPAILRGLVILMRKQFGEV